MSKMSIRFYNDHEVRAVWDDENSKWWFSVLDVLGAINGQELPVQFKCRLKNRYLRVKLITDQSNSIKQRGIYNEFYTEQEARAS